MSHHAWGGGYNVTSCMGRRMQMSHHAWGGGYNVTSCMGRRMQMSHHAWGGGCKCHIMHGEEDANVTSCMGTEKNLLRYSKEHFTLLYMLTYAQTC